MFWILTEDTESGYDILKEMTEKLVYETVNILNPLPFYKTGGNMAAYKLFIDMVHANKINPGDTVYLAIDTLVDTGTVMNKETRLQTRLERRCRTIAGRRGILLCSRTYICMESSFLSFKYLAEFCNIPADTDDPLINYYLKHKKQFLYYNKRSLDNKIDFVNDPAPQGGGACCTPLLPAG